MLPLVWNFTQKLFKRIFKTWATWTNTQVLELVRSRQTLRLRAAGLEWMAKLKLKERSQESKVHSVLQ